VICIDARHAKAALKMQINKSDRIRPLLEARKAIEQQVDNLDRKVLKRARHDLQVRRFMTVPGVGPITALCFKATIDDPTRFKRSRNADIGRSSDRESPLGLSHSQVHEKDWDPIRA
jgi:transposase